MVQIKDLNREKALEILNSEVPPEIADAFDKSYEPDESAAEFYEKNGFIKLEGLLSGEALEYARKVSEAAVYIRKEEDKRTLAEKSQYEQSFLQCGYLCWDYPAMKGLVFGKRFARIAKDLMKTEGVRLWHDQALFKEPGGRGTDIHQDSSYWPVKNPENTITLWLALNDVPVEKGCLYFYPGTHKTGIREYVDIFKNPHKPEGLDENDKVYTPLRAGDATFHSGLTFHGAGKNESDELREGMTVIYIDKNAGFDASDERNATHKSCAGLKHGEKISTVYTPELA